MYYNIALILLISSNLGGWLWLFFTPIITSFMVIIFALQPLAWCVEQLHLDFSPLNPLKQYVWPFHFTIHLFLVDMTNSAEITNMVKFKFHGKIVIFQYQNVVLHGLNRIRFIILFYFTLFSWDIWNNNL